jgi:hypothetical protein
MTPVARLSYRSFYPEALELLCRRARINLSPPMLVGEPVQDAFFKFAEPELDFDWYKTIDISHISSSENDS